MPPDRGRGSQTAFAALITTFIDQYSFAGTMRYGAGRRLRCFLLIDFLTLPNLFANERSLFYCRAQFMRRANVQLAADRRSEILSAAQTCFARPGFHQTSMQEICAEAGMSPGNLYRYFRSK